MMHGAEIKLQYTLGEGYTWCVVDSLSVVSVL